MEDSKEMKQIVDLYNLDNYATTYVEKVIQHAYELDCALEATFSEFEDWLKEIADQKSPDLGWWEKYEGLYNFRGELQCYCNHMPLEEAIEETLVEWIYK